MILSDADLYSASSDYVSTVDIGGVDGKVTNQLKQGGIVSIYYLGAIFGCFGG
jgi:hypothetical protein